MDSETILLDSKPILAKIEQELRQWIALVVLMLIAMVTAMQMQTGQPIQRVLLMHSMINQHNGQIQMEMVLVTIISKVLGALILVL